MIKFVSLVCLAFFIGTVSAQSVDAGKKPAESLAVIELGDAASDSLKDSLWSFGPAAAVEVTPIENWLEIEAGVTALLRPHSTEWDVDMLFKKPWTFSEQAELMIGAGPEWIHAREGGITSNSAGAEAAIDFMYWPREWKRRFGLYVEPAYEYSFGRGHEHSLGMTGGLLIAIP